MADFARADIPARVLIIDDREDSRLALEAALAGLPATIVHARSGEDALRRLLEGGDFACVLLDMRMPGMDGFETARLIRGRHTDHPLPILFVTGVEPAGEEIRRAYALGAVDFIRKPVEPEVLRAKVSVFVDLHLRTCEAERAHSRYEALAELSPVGVFFTDAEGDCLYVNARWCEISGLNPAQAAGKGWAGALHPEDRARVFQEWYDAARTAALFRSEYRFLRPDGRVTWVIGQAKSERDLLGRTVGYVGTITDITDRKEVEAELRGAREALERRVEERTGELRLVTDALPVLVSFVGKDERYVRVNKAYEKWFGRRADEIEGRSLRDVLGEAAYGRIRPHVQAALSGREVSYETEVPYRDGGIRYVEASYAPLRDSHGEVIGFAALVTDLSEKKRQERELRLVLEGALDAVVMMDDRGHVVDWNPQAVKTFGWTREEALGKPMGDLLVPERFREAHRQGLARFLRTGEGPILGRRLELPALLKNGEEIPVELAVVPIRAGERTYFSAFLRDITERKKAGQVSAFLAEIVRSTQDAIVTKTLDGTVTSWNSGAERVFGYSAPEMVGKPITLIIPESRLQEERMIMEKIGRGERVLEYETERRRKDGVAIHVSITVSPLMNAEGKIVGASKIARDITDRVRDERMIRDLNASLEERVQERTAQLQEAVTNLEAFSYSVAHDLKAPVRGMMTYSQILLEDHGASLGADALSCVQRIAQSAVYMDTLIRDLLAYSRVSQDTFELGRVNPSVTVAEILAQMAGEIEARKVRVEVQDPLPAVRAHPIPLAQILTNLFSNALKFVAPGVAPHLKVTGQARDGRVRLWVEDNGIGIPVQYHARLFRLFERLHDQRVYAGTGVGLAIVQKAAERMGGSVGVESEPGKGSRFWVELPLADVPSGLTSGKAC